MSEQRPPWWYSGDEDAEAPKPDGVPPTRAEGFGIPGVDWTALASGAQRLVDWATDRVMAPHAEHSDPSEHPQCVVCRTMMLLGERPPAAPDEAQEHAQSPADIAWIPIVGEYEDP